MCFVRNLSYRLINLNFAIYKKLKVCGICSDMCKSSEICKETRNMVLKIFFFEHTYQIWVFSLFVVYMREICGCIVPIVWYTFSRILFTKMSKKALLFKPQPFSSETIYSMFSFNYYFLILKILILPKVTRVCSWTSKRHKNAQIAEIGSADLFYVFSTFNFKPL